MALDKTDLAFKKLVNRKFTSPVRTFYEELGDTTLEIDVGGIYTDSIPSTTSSAYSSLVAREIKCVLTKDYNGQVNTGSFYVISGSGYTVNENNYNSTFATSGSAFFTVSSSFVQKNFLSPKFGAEYEVILKNSSGEQIYPTDPINWYFDYKTGIVSVANPENKGSPSNGIPYSITASQYIGRMLSSTVLNGNITASQELIKHYLMVGNGNQTDMLATFPTGSLIHGSGHNIFTIADAGGSHVEGSGSTIGGSAEYSHVEGKGNAVYTSYSHAEGDSNFVNGPHAHAEGKSNTIVTSAGGHAEGIRNKVEGQYAHTEGYETTASTSLSAYSHAEGIQTITYGQGSHAEGQRTITSGSSSHAEGYLTVARGLASHAEGSSSLASGSASHAEGYFTTASGNYSHAEGSYTHASGSAVHAEGFMTVARGEYSHAEGGATVASGEYSHAEGGVTMASGHSSHAEGTNTSASADYAHSEGYYTKATANYAHAEGNLTLATAAGAHSEGSNTLANAVYSHAEGQYTTASGQYSHAEGYQTTAAFLGDHAEGSFTRAEGGASHAEGQRTTASGNYSHAEGSSSLASGITSHAEGTLTIASGQYSHAEGLRSRASSIGSHAEGSGSLASAFASHAEGYVTTASGHYAHSEGTTTIALADGSHAEGAWTYVGGLYSHAEGSSAIANGIASHAEGAGSFALGDYSHAEGNSTKTTGDSSHSEGDFTLASGVASHAEGGYTLASGQSSHAEGFRTTASGNYSHAEGSSSLASGIGSHAEGLSTTASADYQHVSGKFNVTSSNTNDLFIIGNGTSAARSNILVVNTSSVIVSGSIGIGTTSPSHKLHVRSADDNAITNIASFWANNETQGVGIRYGGIAKLSPDSDSGLTVDAKGNSHLLLQTISTGNVGIGTSTPTQKLDVAGDSRFAGWFHVDRTGGGLTSYYGIRVRGAAEAGNFGNALGNGAVEVLTSGTSGLIMGTQNASPLAFGTANVERMRITSDGNVGIGTTSPANKLHVFSSAAPARFEMAGSFNVNLASSANLPYWQFLNSANNAVVAAGLDADSLNLGRGNVRIIGVDTPATAPIPARLYVVGDGTNPAAIFNTGNVGIGTTTPNEKLTVEGNISARGDLTASNILINGGSINKVEKFLGLNTSSFGTGTLTNERSKTTDDVIYTSASVNYLLHVHHNSASLQIYNLETRNLVSNVSLTSGKNPNSIYLEGNKAFVGCYGSGSIAIVDISNINSPTTTYASSFGATSYTDDNNFVDPIVFKGNFIFGNISSVKIYNTSSVTFVSSTGVGTRITALHAYTSASVDVLLVLGYGSAGSAGTAFLFAYNITTPSAPVLMSQAPVLNTVLQPLPTAAERFCALTVDRENKYAYVGDSTSNVDDTILRVFDLSDLNFIKTIAEVKLNNGYYPFGTPVINRVSLTSYNTVLVTDTNNKRTFEFDLYDIKKQNGQLVVPIKIYTFNDTPTSVKFFKQQLSEDVIVVSTLNGNISFQNKSNKFIINSVNSDGTDSKNSILSLNNFTANISGSLIVSDNINCKTTINASELQFPNHSKIKSDSNYIRTLSSNHVIISEPTLGYNAAFYDYCVYSGSNIRAGVIAAAFSAGTVLYNETTTADIGNTEQVTMSVAFSGDFIQLLSNASTNVSWSIKAMARYI